MKTLFCITWLLLLSLKNFSQTGSVFLPDSIPATGIVLDKGWKFHPGDNPEWAQQDLDDNPWMEINPTKPLSQMPQLQQAGMGWFRLKVQVHSRLRNKVVGLLTSQWGASEIYLNGGLIRAFGKVSTKPSEVKAYNPSGEPIAASEIVHLQFNNNAKQVLAVRFALEPDVPDIPYLSSYNPVLKIKLNSADKLNENSLVSRGYLDMTPIDFFKGGFILVLGFLHLIFFIYYPKQKANLFFAIYCLLSALFYSLLPVSFQVVHVLRTRVIIQLLLSSLFIGQNTVLLIAVYFLFKHRKGLIYWLIIGVTIALIIQIIISYFVGPLLISGIFFTILVNLEAIRISILAALKNQKGAWLIALGGIGYVIFVSGYLLNAFFNTNLLLQVILQYVLSNLGIISLPIVITLYLAREFARTNIFLELKVSEVEKLSAQTIAQEKEKQQILAEQNETLERQVTERTTEVIAQKQELQRTLTHLQSTQEQLIQKEKMASLGELTAGIAHEVQNPLNFVNNFSEVNQELLTELKEELAKGNLEEVEILAANLEKNEQIIKQHGYRADSIVKGMLQHARNSSGEKIPTDINALTEEYLQLAYHGLRAKDKDFNASLITNFDPSIQKIEVVPQELGRVLLNLYNNAFYATQKKKTQLNGQYEPEIRVSTSRQDDRVEIRVRDNGCGIPENIKTKIFQPFFTTKPTGQGTGLGLSLSYDIITKVHHGELMVESKEGKFAEFFITLPISNLV